MNELPETQAPGPRRWLDADAGRLFFCGAAILFWELVLIRWLGASIRIVAYFANLILISAFFGLGVGALLTRFRWGLEKWIAPVAALTVLLGIWLGDLFHLNPAGDVEFFWIGAPLGVPSPSLAVRSFVSVGLILTLVYCTVAVLFALFGQFLGRLFRTHPPLRAYSLEIGGSLAGIALMALLSYWQTSPTTWFVVGFVLLLLALPPRLPTAAVTAVLCALVVAATWSSVSRSIWSPYYRITVEPLTSIVDMRGEAHDFGRTVGRVLTVNNDYHQMMLDLRPTDEDHPFLAGWRTFYDAPYRSVSDLPPGPILIVGAGTGNDVSAALRNTGRDVVAVEIDPGIADLGSREHVERPYQSPRVTSVIDDARSYFHHTDERFALVVFGFLDSHRLLSAFSSVRLDNFIYTRESMGEVRDLLLPGGRVALSFATNTPWIHERIIKLLNGTFDYPTRVEADPNRYANGLLYVNGVSATGRSSAPPLTPRDRALVPTDDWPFLYLQQRAVPAHNVAFVIVAVLLSLAALMLLPRGERRVRLPYFFLGAGFFVLETSNVVRMSLLWGSTWWVNTMVFAGILLLVLLSNLTAARWRVPVTVSLGALGVGILLAASIPSEWVLELSPLPRAIVATALYLGPVYFGGLIFARLIAVEARLFEAYGSNVLGAVVGGAAEYLSVILGFNFLFAVALSFYLAVYVSLKKEGALA